MYKGNLKNFSSAADSNMDFCGCVATPAILSAWSLSVVSGAVSAPVAVPGGWQRGAALLVDEVLPEQPVRQWVLSFPFQLRFLFASRPEVMGRVLGIV